MIGYSLTGNYYQGTYIFPTEHLMGNINDKRISPPPNVAFELRKCLSIRSGKQDSFSEIHQLPNKCFNRLSSQHLPAHISHLVLVFLLLTLSM